MIEILNALHSALSFLLTDLSMLLQGKIGLDQLADDPCYLSIYRAALVIQVLRPSPPRITDSLSSPTSLAHKVAHHLTDDKEPIRPPITFVVLSGEILPYPISTR